MSPAWIVVRGRRRGEDGRNGGRVFPRPLQPALGVLVKTRLPIMAVTD